MIDGFKCTNEEKKNFREIVKNIQRKLENSQHQEVPVTV